MVASQKGSVARALMFPVTLAPKDFCTNCRVAYDLRRHDADLTAMQCIHQHCML